MTKCVWTKCVLTMCGDKVCGDKVCGDKVCVDKCVVTKCGGGRRRRRRRRSPGYRIKNKNPTQRCGEKPWPFSETPTGTPELLGTSCKSLPPLPCLVPANSSRVSRVISLRCKLNLKFPRSFFSSGKILQSQRLLHGNRGVFLKISYWK